MKKVSNCIVCGKSMYPKPRGQRIQKYCSAECYRGYKTKKVNRERVLTHCLTCGKEILLPECKVSGKNFCSEKCLYTGRSKRLLTWHGITRPTCSKCGKKIWWGNTLCGSCCKKDKVGNRAGQHSVYCGEKHHNWKGGITPINLAIRNSLEYRQWRNKVFERDMYTCTLCGYKGSRLQADHIKPFSLYPELRFEISNGRVLCVDCHRTTDTWGYRKDYRERTISYGEK